MSSFKCDDCQTNDGLFQCCHCSQRLCIHCCNKHYKKVTAELEYLHELNDHLLTKIVHIKANLEKQKNQTIEQCQQWRIDTINTINQAHTLIIQTIHDEYEILSKEYELFIEKEMLHINIDKNQLLRMKKGNLGSLLSSPSSSITTDSNKSLATVKKRIEIFTKYMDQLGTFSFQVKLPKFDIDDTLRVESTFGDITRSTSVTWQDYDNDPSSSEKVETTTAVKKDRSQNEHKDYSRTSPSIDNEDTYQSVQHVHLKREEEGSSIQIEQSQKNDGIIEERRTCIEACGVRRKTAVLPARSSNVYPWIYHRANSTPSFIQ